MKLLLMITSILYLTTTFASLMTETDRIPISTKDEIVPTLVDVLKGKKSDQIEVCFAMDTSTSMMCDYKQITKEFDKLQKHFKDKFDLPPIIHIVEFGQVGKKEPDIRDMQSKGDLTNFKDYLNKVKIKGDVEPQWDAIDSCEKMLSTPKDNKTVRIIIVISDEPGDMTAKSVDPNKTMKKLLNKDVNVVVIDTSLIRAVTKPKKTIDLNKPQP